MVGRYTFAVTTRRGFLWLSGASGAGFCLATAVPDVRRAPMRIRLTGACSFCGQRLGEVFAIFGVSGREERICDECLGMCLDVISHPSARSEYASRFSCSFCDRPYRDVAHLISGPRVFICDNCTRDAGNALAAWRSGSLFSPAELKELAEQTRQALAAMTPDEEMALRSRYGLA